MKKLVLLSLAVFSFVIVSTAQNSKVVSAYNYIKYEDFDKAKEAIDIATDNPKTGKQEKTWYYRGIIYFNLYAYVKDKENIFRDLAPEGYDEAYKSFKKSLILNIKDPSFKNFDIENNEEDLVKFMEYLMDVFTYQKFHLVYSGERTADIMQNQLPSLGYVLRNVAVDAFEAKDYAKALDYFEKSLFCSQFGGKVDTVVMYNAALAAEKAQKYDDAIQYYKQVTKLGYGANTTEKATMWTLYANAHMLKNDTVKFLETLEKARKKYPDESIIIITQMNHFINLGQPEKAEDLIKLAIEKEPENKLLHFNLGFIYETTERVDLAEESYKKALEIDPAYLDAAYNMGAIYISKAVDVDKEQVKHPFGSEEFNKFELQKVDLWKTALPYLEKAYELNTEDKLVTKTLWGIYRNIGTYHYNDGNTKRNAEEKNAQMTEAVKYYKKAFELKPEDTLTAETISDIYKILGDTENADKYLKISKGE
jgi:tetratricopeptide (TPR) repeat protein